MTEPGNIPLDSEAIRASLPVDLQALAITVLQEVDSTNDWCRRELVAGKDAPYLCPAEAQSAGKGRRGRHWLAAPGDDIILSYMRHFDVPLHMLGCMSLVVGLAVKSCLQDAGVGAVKLKWPNDVLVGSSKIAGVLIESAAVATEQAVLIIGIGINVGRRQLPGIEMTCLRDHVDGVIDRGDRRVVVRLVGLGRHTYIVYGVPFGGEEVALIPPIQRTFETAREH